MKKSSLATIALIFIACFAFGGCVRFNWWRFHQKYPQASVWVFILGG